MDEGIEGPPTTMEALECESAGDHSRQSESDEGSQEALLPQSTGEREEERVRERKNSAKRNFQISAAATACALLVTTFVLLMLLSTRDSEGNERRKEYKGPTRVLLVSLDAFRWDYVLRSNAKAPHIRRLAEEGTRAAWMQPVFPSKTFPNHWSMVTGLLPAWHGVVGNRFQYNNFTESFTPSNEDPQAWKGDPIWATAQRQGKLAKVVFWPGSDVTTGGWHCHPDLCKPYDGKVNDTMRARMALNWLTQQADQLPDFLALYQETTDDVGHMYGPNTPEMTAAIEEVDANLGIVIEGLERHGSLDAWNIVVVSDHGMASTCKGHFIYIDDITDVADISQWIDGDQGPFMMLDPPSEEDLNAWHRKLKDATSKGAPFKAYIKDNFPEYLGWFNVSQRVPPLLVLPAEGYQVVTRDVVEKYDKNCDCRGNHGWDNTIQDMMATFIARGPRFARGAVAEPFLDINIYELVATLLGIEASPNNGSALWAHSIGRIK